MRYVVDCSVAVKWFVPEPLREAADAVLDQFMAEELSLVAPESIVAELGHALPLASMAMRLTTQHQATFFDALYIALAQRDDISVFTADGPLATIFAPLGRTLHLADFKPS